MPRLPIAVLLSLLATLGLAGEPYLVKDINTGGDSVLGSPCLVGEMVLFCGNGPDGFELWVHDSQGVRQLADLNPGPASSQPQGFVTAGAWTYFSAIAAQGRELWRTDGTAAGTVQVADIDPGGGSSSPSNLTVLNGRLYFRAYDTSCGYELWTSDGTSVGTVRVADIEVGGESSNPDSLTVSNNRLFFTARTTVGGWELWTSDGTSAGTLQVADIYVGSGSSSPYNLTALNGRVYFRAQTPVGGYELWTSDGTVAGTVQVADIYAGSGSSVPANLTELNGRLYFSAQTTSSGNELWTSDGTSAGTMLVADIYAGGGSSNPESLTVLNGRLWFRAQTPSGGYELWTSDGTSAGTMQVADIEAGSLSSLPSNLKALNGRLYFSAQTTSSGNELWTSDGTSAGTVLVADIKAGSGSSSPTYLTALNGRLYFSAQTTSSGWELWASDGTSAGTVRVSDLAAGSGSSYPDNLAVLNGRLFFRAFTSSAGSELWASDGTSAGTVQVADIYAGSGSSSPSYLKALNGRLYFAAYTASEGSELWASDGTFAGTVRISDMEAGSGSSYPDTLTVLNGRLFFRAYTTSGGYELWTSDGTPAGTAQVADIYAGSSSSSPQNLTALNGRLYFSAQTTSGGYELWTSDGTSAGTVQVADINAGGGSSYPESLTVLNGRLYFRAQTSSGGTELWASDGTSAGTVQVADIAAGSASSSPTNLTVLNGRLYFRAQTSGGGSELWTSDGTSAGTVQVADIAAGSGSSYPQNLTVLNGRLYFSAQTTSSGYELWTSDGTSAGTVQVADIAAGSASSSPSNLTALNGRLYFSAQTMSGGSELWMSDGTSAGTVLVADLEAGPTGSVPAYFTAVGNRLFFTAVTLGRGRELYALDTGLPQTLTGFAPLATRTYGDAPFTISGVTGGASGQPVFFSSDNPAVAVVSGSTVTIVGAGSATITATQAGAPGYAAADPVSQILTVAPCPLSITAVSCSRAYGAANHLTWSVSGLVRGDAVTVTMATTATGTSPLGSYPISIADYHFTTGSAANYAVTTVAGSLTVRPLIVANLGSVTDPAMSAKDLLLRRPGVGDGLYFICPDGPGGEVFPAWCDMTTLGGGWTLALVSLAGDEVTTTDLISNTGTAGYTTAHTRNIRALAIDRDAQIAMDIVHPAAGRFRSYWSGRYHGSLPQLASWSTMPGHTAAVGQVLSAELGQAWNPAHPAGRPWFGTAYSSIPTVPADAITGPRSLLPAAALTSFRILVREGAPPVYPPALAPIADQSVDCFSPLAVTASAADAHGSTVVYSLTAPSPGGATIDAASGVLTWTPTAAGDHVVTVQAACGTLTATTSFTVHVRAVPVTFANPAIAVTYDGQAQPVVPVTVPAGAAASVVVTYQPHDGDPAAGASPVGAVTTVAPSDVGWYRVALSVEGGYSGSAATSLQVLPRALTVAANAATRAAGTANPVFTGSLTGAVPADGISSVFVSSATTATPAGVYGPTSVQAITPVLADPLHRLGNYAVTSTNGTLTITIAVPVISTAGLPAGIVGIAYDCTLAASNGPTGWAIASGTLPAGLALDAAIGRITGVPTAAGTSAFTIVASNAGGPGSPVGYAVRIDPPALPYQPAAASLAVSRRAHTATLLSSGWVMVAGGYGPNSLASCEMYDVAAGEWRSADPMRYSRSWHSATMLGDGRVLIVGGRDHAGQSLASCELFDPITCMWQETGPLDSPVHGQAAVRLTTGKVLIVGGYGTAGYRDACRLYDPASGSWSATGSLNIPRNVPTAVLLPSGKVLVVGGYRGADLATCELYDPAMGTWSLTGSLATARHQLAATLLPTGKVLAAGGGTATCELFDPSSGTWSATGAMAVSRFGLSLTRLPSGRILASGGGPILCESYDPASGSWTSVANSRSGRANHTATMLPGGSVLLVGGDTAACERTGEDTGYAQGDRPVLSSVPATLARGGRLVLGGSGFTGSAEGSSGASNSSPANHPLVQIRCAADATWRWLAYHDGDGFTSGSVTTSVVPDLPIGPAWVRIVVNGIPSLEHGLEVTGGVAPLVIAADSATTWSAASGYVEQVEPPARVWRIAIGTPGQYHVWLKGMGGQVTVAVQGGAMGSARLPASSGWTCSDTIVVLAAREWDIAFGGPALAGLEDIMLLPVTPAALDHGQPVIAGPGSVAVIEAEDYDAVAGNADGTAWLPVMQEGRAAVIAQPDLGRWCAAGGRALAYDVWFTAGGTYRFWIRGMGGPHSDSVHIAVDGVPVVNGLGFDNYPTSTTRLSWGSFATNLVRADVTVGAGLHRITVSCREDGVMLDQLAIAMVGWAPADAAMPDSVRQGLYEQDRAGLLSLPASGTHQTTPGRYQHDWQVVGADLRALPDSGVTRSAKDWAMAPGAWWQVRFARGGRHSVHVLGVGPNGAGDSVHIGLAGPATTAADVDLPAAADLTPGWSSLRTSGTPAYIDVPAAGDYAIGLWLREDGASVRQIVIQPETTLPPSGTTPTSSPLAPVNPIGPG